MQMSVWKLQYLILGIIKERRLPFLR